MNSKDLMIGDWVICNHYQDKPFTKQFGIADFAKGEYEFCDPIPLTEEILVKNGFERLHHKGTGATEEYSEWFLGGIKITEWLEDWKDHHFSTGGDDCPISFNYVHQLQHLLRLCGVQKEIEL